MELALLRSGGRQLVPQYHCFDRYVKVTFFRGTSMDPVPPESSKTRETRYFHVPESGEFDENQFSDWGKQASELPGEKM